MKTAIKRAKKAAPNKAVNISTFNSAMAKMASHVMMNDNRYDSPTLLMMFILLL